MFSCTNSGPNPHPISVGHSMHLDLRPEPHSHPQPISLKIPEKIGFTNSRPVKKCLWATSSVIRAWERSATFTVQFLNDCLGSFHMGFMEGL
jgi:hypothetical protein